MADIAGDGVPQLSGSANAFNRSDTPPISVRKVCAKSIGSLMIISTPEFLGVAFAENLSG
jgi:hypothetical protein